MKIGSKNYDEIKISDITNSYKGFTFSNLFNKYMIVQYELNSGPISLSLRAEVLKLPSAVTF